MPAMRKAEVEEYLVHQTVFGGDANEYVTIAMFRKFADLDRGSPLVRALGEDGTRALIGKLGPLTRSVERYVIKRNAGLSYSATEAVSNGHNK